MTRYYNKTKCPQIMDSNGIQQNVIMPNMIFKETDFNIRNWEPYEIFEMEILKNNDVVNILRTYALGDLIQLVVVARIFKKQYNIKNVRILTSPRYVNVLNFLFRDIYFTAENNLQWFEQKDGFTISLNNILEKDHNLLNLDIIKHRVDIMLEYLECEKVNKSDIDWSTQMKYIPITNISSNLPKIGLQIRGSGKMKTLPYSYIKKIASSLSKQYTVILIDQDINKGFEGKNIINLCGKTNIPQLLQVMRELDCCITMDSGVLWLAHIVDCPVITLLGPTREHERLSLHPSYPEKVKAVELQKMVNCKPCFETMKYCNGKINCMNNVNCDTIIEEIEKNIKLILGVC